MNSRCHPVGTLSGLLSGWVCARALIVISTVTSQPAVTAPWPLSAHTLVQPKRSGTGQPIRGPSRSGTILLSDVGGLPEAVLNQRGQGATALSRPDDVGVTEPAASVRIALAPAELDQPQQPAAEQFWQPPAVTRSVQIARPRPMVSTWLAVRGSVGRSGERASLASSGQLGGSQAGARLILPVKSLGKQAALNLSARATTALGRSRGQEAALGVTVRREGAIPIEIGIERRIGLDKSGRNAFALVAATGVYDRPVATGMTVNGHLQAGLVGARRRDAFADGAVSLDRQIFSQPSLSLLVGGGAWGAVQPGLSRLDIGPVATLRVSGPAGPVRISAAWRFRVAGNARPGSGPAITIGTDF